MGILEYLRKALPNSLQHLSKGCRDLQEGWKRLDERFSDRIGAIRAVLKNLVEADVGKGKAFFEGGEAPV